MVMALLIALGVPLIIVVAFAVIVLKRKRWLKAQPGVFAGALRVSKGDIDGLKPKWKRGSGRWVRDVFVWSNGPTMLRSALVLVDGRSGERETDEGEVKRLGDQPVAVEFAVDGANVEVAAKAEDRALVTGPLTTAATAAQPITAAAQPEARPHQAAVNGG